jgi:hypothetical protein
MRFAFLTVLMAASIGLAACSSGAGSPATPGVAAGSVRPTTQSCYYYYVECITLANGKPFRQEWCVWHALLSFGSSCNASSGFTWGWQMKVRHVGHQRKCASKIEGSFSPNPGDPTTVTISENRRIRPSGGKIVCEVQLRAHTGNGSSSWADIGISTK